MPYFPSLPDDASIPHIWNAHPAFYAPFSRAMEAAMRGPSAFSPAERELIAAYVSGLNACTYCVGGHVAAAEAFGVETGLFEQLLDNVDSAGVDARLKPVLMFVKKLTLTPARMTQADADAVFAAGWDERALHDAIVVCSMFNFMNRLVDGHGIQTNPDVFGERGRRHKDLGYLDQFPELRDYEARQMAEGSKAEKP